MIQIRPGRPEDDDRLRKIDRRTWSPLVSPVPPQAPERAFFSERLARQDVLVAVEGVLRGEFLLDGREVDDVLMACRLDGPAGD